MKKLLDKKIQKWKKKSGGMKKKSKLEKKKTRGI